MADYFGLPQMEKQKQIQQQQAQERSHSRRLPFPSNPARRKPPGTGARTASADAARRRRREPMTRDATLAASPRVRIDTPSLSGSIALKGGRIDDLSLVKYRETVDPNSPPIVLLAPSGSPYPFMPNSVGRTERNDRETAGGRDTVWQQEGSRRALGWSAGDARLRQRRGT